MGREELRPETGLVSGPGASGDPSATFDSFGNEDAAADRHQGVMDLAHCLAVLVRSMNEVEITFEHGTHQQDERQGF